jgi:hypothetical protein
MDKNSIDLNGAPDRDKGEIYPNLEKVAIIGVIICSSLLAGDNFTDFGTNPLNYLQALTAYSV